MLCGKSDEKTGLTPRNLLAKPDNPGSPDCLALFFRAGAGRAGRPRPFPIPVSYTHLPPLPPHHSGDDVTASVIGAVQVYPHQGAPFLRRQIGQELLRRRTGIVDEDGNFAEN